MRFTLSAASRSKTDAVRPRPSRKATSLPVASSSRALYIQADIWVRPIYFIHRGFKCSHHRSPARSPWHCDKAGCPASPNWRRPSRLGNNWCRNKEINYGFGFRRDEIGNIQWSRSGVTTEVWQNQTEAWQNQTEASRIRPRLDRIRPRLHELRLQTTPVGKGANFA